MGTKWLEPTEREVGSVLRRSDLGLAALAGAGATLVAVGLLLPVYGPRNITIEGNTRTPSVLTNTAPGGVLPCTEDGVVTTRTPSCLTVTGSKPCDLTLYDGSCGHPDTAHFTDGYWFQGASDDAGTIAPLQLEK